MNQPPQPTPHWDDSKPFSERIQVALDDAPLRRNFRGAMDFLMAKRQAQFPDAGELESLRVHGEAIRQRTLHRLPDLLEQLETRCRANGIRVHWAEDSKEANQLILDILNQRGARRLVKGKSMASEEIHLNQELGRAGIECLETDMGEYIVQLAGETPSHIIMPAIHKTREDIARLFAEHLPGVAYTEDVDQLIGIGRRVLREKFAEADAGLSGVNFAIAETGTLCLVENEGNGRMSTTVPPLHIALMGIEKVIERLEDLPPLLSLLTRSATGQAITTYVNLISRPRQPDELDGPQEVHLILLDNGRSRIDAHPQLQQSLRCIRCGACMNHCPVYTRIGGHAYGTVYPGPIGQVIMPQLEGLERHGDLPQACSLNGACGDACPVRIPLPDLIRQLRQESVTALSGPGKQDPTRKRLNRGEAAQSDNLPGRGSRRSRSEAWLWRLWCWLNSAPRLYRFSLYLATHGRLLFPQRLGPWTQYRQAPRPASQSFQALYRQRQKHKASSTPSQTGDSHEPKP